MQKKQSISVMEKWKKLLKVTKSLNIFIENFYLGINSILVNKTRALLSILGVMIGIASVISVTSLGQSATVGIKKMIEGIGTSNVIVSANNRGNKARLMVKKLFTMKLPLMLKDNISNIENVIIDTSLNVKAEFMSESDNFTLRATSPDWIRINNYKPAMGRFLLKNDANRMNIVIGHEVAETLFPEENSEIPIGRYLKLYYKKRFFTCQIVGVMEEKTRTLISDFNSDIYIDETTFRNKMFKVNTISRFFIMIDKPENAKFVTDMIDLVLKRLGDIPLAETRGLYFRILSQKEMLEMYENVSTTLSLLLGGIAAIALLVGGIGIMNIMLVSVTERTKEIGIRKALGAKNSYIFSQFLIEASLISVVGGVIGVILGIGITYLLTKGFNMVYSINVTAIFISIVFSVLIGEFFGFYPARKAASLNPTDALRYE